MRFYNFLLGRQEFKNEQEIKNTITSSKKYKKDLSSPENSNALLIFQTSNQQTWLVATKNRLYCILDDIKKGTTKVNWSMDKDEIVSNNQIILSITTNNKSEKTGLLNIGERRKNWLFSKKLFVLSDIKDSIKSLIEKTMIEV